MRYGIDIPDHPRTIQEKLIWLQFYDPMNYLKPICADKLRVREYAKEKLGKDICVPVLKVYDRPEDFNLEELPNRFAIKSNHSNNQVILCKDKSKLNRNDVVITMKNWLSKPFGVATCEPHYMYIQRKCYVEELLDSGTNGLLTDYKFFCFNGEPKLMHMVLDYHTPRQRMHYYDMNGKFRSDINRNGYNVRLDFQKNDKLPVNFDLMKEYARKLATPFKFVRVDFFEANGRAYLGEMTFVPGAAKLSYKDPKTSLILGDMIKL